MESRFARLRQRDNSVDMLRIKMSRRRSQSQKENRDRAVNSRRQMTQLPEMEGSTLEASMNMSTVQEKAPTTAKQSKDSAREERMKMLTRFKEKKALQKEKEKREKEKKGVFKVGLYRPQKCSVLVPLPEVCTTAVNPKPAAGTAQNSRVTRSMKQPQAPKAPHLQTAKTTVSAPGKVEPAVVRATRSRTAVVPSAPAAAAAARNRVAIVEPMPRALSTRSANRPPAVAVPVTRDKPAADARSTRTRAKVQVTSPSKGNGRNSNSDTALQATIKKVTQKEKTKPEATHCPVIPTPTAAREEKAAEEEEEEEEEELVEDPTPVECEAPPSTAPSSFAPQGFTFQAPAIMSFKLTPLTPRSAEAFLTPSPIIHFPPVPLFSACLEAKSDLDVPSSPKSMRCSAAHPSSFPAVPAQCSPLEPQHDVPYFRSEIVSETSKLTGLCHLWEPRVEEEAIPGEMRDSMRTAVGQARLLMKERFGQFAGLVDDCELGRGEKITTCSDLQGFWDMVYYQVEDVYRKFGTLKELESKGWVEEQKPAPSRQKKLVKKPHPAAVSKPIGTSTAAKSRLAAIKAAMKAKQQAAEKQSAQATGDGFVEPAAQPEPRPQGATPAPSPEKVVFHGGFFQVESPAKLPGSVRKSSRLSAHPSPSSLTKYVTQGRGRRSVAACHASHFLRLSETPGNRTPRPNSQPGTPRPDSQPGTPRPDSQPGTPRPDSQPGTLRQPPSSRASLCFSPVIEAPSMDTEPEASPVDQSQSVAGRNVIAPDQSERELAHENANEDEMGVVAEPTEDHEDVDQSLAREMLPSNDDKPQELSLNQSVSVSESESSGWDCVARPEISQPVSAPLDAQDGTEALGEPCPGASLPLSPSSHLSDVSSPVQSPALSFSLSPYPAHATPARPADLEPSLPVLSSPYLQASALPVVQLAPTESGFDLEESMGVTPDTSITGEVPGLDFERYLQPSARCSLSPQVTAALEMASPMATDVEMDSPVAQPRDLLAEEEEEVLVTPSALHRAPRVFASQTPQVQPTALSELLFFTPDPKDRIRQSVCPSDLMVFTPPSHR